MRVTGSSASEVLNAITAPDAYTTTPQFAIQNAIVDHFLIDVSNQAIYWQLQKSLYGGGAGEWEDVEVFMQPGSRTIHREGAVGIRIRAAVPLASLPAGLSQALVTVEAVK